MYAFMSQGEAKFSNGKSFTWHNVMPSRSVLFKYKKIVRKYEKENIYSEYLPLKLVNINF